MTPSQKFKMNTMIVIRLFFPLFMKTCKYVFLFVALYLIAPSFSLAGTILDFLILIPYWMIHTPYEQFQKDALTGIFFILVFLGIGWLFFFSKWSKFNFIGNDISFVIGNIWFSRIFLGKTFDQYKKDQDDITLYESIVFYFNFGAWKFDYFSLTEIEKNLIASAKWENLKLFTQVKDYFKSRYNVSIESFESQDDGTKILKIHRPKGFISENFLKQNTSDMIHDMGCKVDDYTLSMNVSGEIELIFVSKKPQKRIEIVDYIEKFLRNTYYFGLDQKNRLVSFPIKYSHANHLGIYGKTGQGKSVFSSSILYTLYIKNKNYRFYVIDPKFDFFWTQSVQRIRYATKVQDILKRLSEILLIMRNTQDEFAIKSVANMEQYFDKVPENERKSFIQPTFIFIEEFGLLLGQVRELGSEAEEKFLSAIKTIVMVGRGFGCTALISLQKPIAESLGSATIKDMIMSISFNTSSTGEVSAFGEKTGMDLDKLRIGEAVYHDGSEYVKFRSLYIEQELLNTLQRDYGDITQDITQEYYEYAKSVNSFSFTEGIQYGLSKPQFDSLSKELQALGVIEKLSNNKLIFRDISSK